MTYQADACPGCGSLDLASRPALMSPFIASYVLGRPPEVCALMSCAACGLKFYATRYDDAEISRLYDGYRGERYLDVRHRFEPWYTRKFNDDLGGPAGIAPRRAVYRATLGRLADPASIGSVLDYAGDRGQMMEGGPGREHYVYEISGVAPAPGVTGITEAAALAGRMFDLVLLCGVVEHFSEPLAQVRRAAAHVRPGGLLYIEVPYEQFGAEAVPTAGWYAAYLKAIARSRAVTLAVDFWSTAVRVKFRAIPPLGFVKQHEHMNYFNVKSLSHLVAAVGFKVIECTTRETGGSVVALCRRPIDNVAATS